MNKRVAIVGAGMAGLSAGVYARLNGYDVDIFETQALPGGLCTSWKRQGYTFDGCVHWLTGSGPSNPFYSLWEEVGAIQGRAFDDPVAFQRFTDHSGRSLIFYADVDRLERHLTSLSPQDAEPAHELCDLVRAMKRMSIRMDKAFELFGPLDILRLVLQMLPVRKQYSACMRTSLGEFAARFKDPLIRAGLELTMDPRMSLIGFVSTMADMARGSAGYPLGGSLPLARAVEQRCLGLGTRIHYRRAVRRVLVRSGAATGLELADGTRIEADAVISAADLRGNLDRLLEGRFPSPAHERLFQRHALYPAATQVSFGVNKVFSEDERSVSHWLQLPRPRPFGGRTLEWVRWANYGHDASLAPSGKSVVNSLVEIPYEFWNRLGRETDEYRRAKVELASLLQAELDRALPGFSAAVEAVDVATPLTFERYTGNEAGRYMTWIPEKDGAREVQSIPKTVPGLDGFYMAGMWVMAPGGLPAAVKTARDVVQLLCRRDRVRFQAPKPTSARAVE